MRRPPLIAQLGLVTIALGLLWSWLFSLSSKPDQTTGTIVFDLALIITGSLLTWAVKHAIDQLAATEPVEPVLVEATTEPVEPVLVEAATEPVEPVLVEAATEPAEPVLVEAATEITKPAAVHWSVPLFFSTMLAGCAAALENITWGNPLLILGCWAAGWISFLYCAYLVNKVAFDPAETTVKPAEPAFDRWEWLLVGGLTIAAAIARFFAVAQIPFAFHGDEGEMGRVARQVLSGELTQPFVTAWLDHPTLWFFLQAFGLKLFGDNMAGLRSFSALIGTAAIPACYFFTRANLGRRIALFATILLATYHFHIHFSRIGLNNIMDPLMVLLTLGALLYGWRLGSIWWMGLAGLFVGLAQHFYVGSRLIPILIAVLFLIFLALDARRVWRQRIGILMLGFGALVAFGPLLAFFIDNPVAFMARLSAQGLFQTERFSEFLAKGLSPQQILLNQTWQTIGGYFSIPDSGLFYARESGLIDQPGIGILLIGLALAIWRFRQPIYALLIIWIVLTTIFGGILLIDPPQSPRYLIAAPAICILIAIGIDQFITLLKDFFFIPERISSVAATFLTIIIGAASLYSYFVVFTPHMRYGGTRDLTSIAYYIQSHPDRYPFFLGAPNAYREHGTIGFITYESPGANVLEPITTPDQTPVAPNGQRAVYIALSFRLKELALIQQRFPGGKFTAYPDPVGIVDPLFAIYETP